MVAKVNVNDFATTQEIIEYIRKHKMLSYREEMEARQAIYRRSGIRDPKTITEQDVRRLTTPVLKFLLKDTFTIQPDVPPARLSDDDSARRRYSFHALPIA